MVAEILNATGGTGRRSRRIATGLLMVMLAAPGACVDDRAPQAPAIPPTPTAPPTSPPASAMPADFTVTLGSGGGVAGSWHTTTIADDGLVIVAERGCDQDASRVTGQLPADSRAAIWQKLHDTGFARMPNEPGNMTTAVSVTADGRITTAAASHGALRPDFQALVAFLEAQIATAGPPPGAALALGLQVRFTADAGRGGNTLEFTVTNHSDAPLRVPNGATVAAYMDDPFGLDLDLRDATGHRFRPDPGAGGPAYPITAEHFTTLAPGERLVRKLAVGGWRRDGTGATRAILGQTPGSYRARARWRCDGFGGQDPGPVWRGSTSPCEITFAVR